MRRAGEIVDDIVSDMLRRLVAYHHACPAEIVTRIEGEIRRDWGGERPYVAKRGEAPRLADRLARDQQIILDLLRAERPQLLSRRHGISVRRIQQIWREYQQANALKRVPG